MTDRFYDKVVLVTGAAGGIGRAYALGFAGEGASLVVTDADESGLQETADLLAHAGARCIHRTMDLAAEPEMLAFAAEIAERFPAGIDVLINNAAMVYGEVSTAFDTLDQAKWIRYFTVNTIAPVLLAKALRECLSKTKGVILNQSSMSAYTPAQAYGVTKAALNAMTYGMAHMFAADGVRVNAIAPGLIRTPALLAQVTTEVEDWIRQSQLTEIIGETDDLVSLALFLASDAARFINAEVVHCDAGSRLRGWRG